MFSKQPAHTELFTHFSASDLSYEQIFRLQLIILLVFVAATSILLSRISLKTCTKIRVKDGNGRQIIFLKYAHPRGAHRILN